MGRAPTPALQLAAVVLYASACLLLAPQPSHAQLVKPAVTTPDYTIYKRRVDLLREVVDMAAANPDTMSAQTKTAQDGDYRADVLVVTLEPGGLSTSRSGKARLLLDFGQHGREFITSEVGLQFLRTLTNSTLLDAAAGSARRAARLRRILDACAFEILPMENVGGRDLVESGRLCERKNGRGVDTNRNWGVHWGVKEKDYDPSEEFPGRAPHSEPEVQIIMKQAKALKPHVWLNVHSGMYALFTPYDHKPIVPEGEGQAAAMRMLQRINELSCKGECALGSGGKSVGYLAHGTATDYMYDVLKVPLAFTWEIYGDTAAPFEDCFRMFNPVGRVAFKAAAEPAAPEQPDAAAPGAALQPAPGAAHRHGRNAEAEVPPAAEVAELEQAREEAGGGGERGEERQQQQQQQQRERAAAEPAAPRPLRMMGGAGGMPARLEPSAAARGGGRLGGAQLAAPALVAAVMLGSLAWGRRSIARRALHARPE
ncbi:MAG: Zn-dependent exopeptidase [Monoraphidium minutum]|nr:MAG: Zn-dependent exopeptidase [Monoraphidium minutum]